MGSRFHGRGASTTHTGPEANVIGCPAVVVNVVPSSVAGRDQRMSQARPSRSTTPVPEPVLSAYGGGFPYSRNREVRTVVYWITTVAALSWPSSVLRAREPSIRTSQRLAAADQVRGLEAKDH